jgi:hypothetical protein
MAPAIVSQRRHRAAMRPVYSPCRSSARNRNEVSCSSQLPRSSSTISPQPDARARCARSLRPAARARRRRGRLPRIRRRRGPRPLPRRQRPPHPTPLDDLHDQQAAEELGRGTARRRSPRGHRRPHPRTWTVSASGRPLGAHQAPAGRRFLRGARDAVPTDWTVSMPRSAKADDPCSAKSSRMVAPSPAGPTR